MLVIFSSLLGIPLVLGADSLKFYRINKNGCTALIIKGNQAYLGTFTNSLIVKHPSNGQI